MSGSAFGNPWCPHFSILNMYISQLSLLVLPESQLSHCLILRICIWQFSGSTFGNLWGPPFFNPRALHMVILSVHIFQFSKCTSQLSHCLILGLHIWPMSGYAFGNPQGPHFFNPQT